MSISHILYARVERNQVFALIVSNLIVISIELFIYFIF